MRSCVFRVVKVWGRMRKAEEEARRGARRGISGVKGGDGVGVLDGLVGGLEGQEAAAGGGLVSASARDVMDEDDVDMESDDED
ncbi:uncharacterized protein CDV56_105821 [Aspergillus thermomutatus]|uniref:Uncharacterized protein n=1 Tax=Aspergillus thermomutatus TaxID=41047 RepID=A0A397G9C7_ASPTH|nr:uncharacterized protein CDV56_105821 [Aspergillus thermomutatus]RHZ47581.1 hypothetical protein CDV56_105821 [Aspergillus thermomutatus]